MNKKICVLCLLLTMLAMAETDSCEGLSKLDRLACQKSVHRQNVKNRRADKTINTAADMRKSDKTVSGKHRPASRQAAGKAKVRLPHNRKVSNSLSTAVKPIKKDTRHRANEAGHNVINQQDKLDLDQGIAVSRSELLASESAVDAVGAAKIPVVDSNMLSSQLSYGSDIAGVGDDALYQIY